MAESFFAYFVNSIPINVQDDVDVIQLFFSSQKYKKTTLKSSFSPAQFNLMI